MSVEEFTKCPSEPLLHQCNKEQLLNNAENFQRVIGTNRLRKLKNILKVNLQEKGICEDDKGESLGLLLNSKKSCLC